MFQIQPAMRKNTFSRLAVVAFGFVGATIGVSAQVFPLSENSWNNPAFVERFLGTYGKLTELEPQISSAEATVFQRLAEVLQQGDNAAAITLIRGALTPESSAALDYTLGNLLLQGGQNEPAMRHYRDAIRKYPRFLRAYKNLGLARVQDGQFEEARDMFIKSLELGDKEGNTFGLLGYCYLNLSAPGLARDSYSLARVLNPGNRDWVIGYGQSLMQTNDFRKAISVFDELIEQQPDSEQYYSVVANAYISLQEYETASRYLEILHRMGKADAAALGLLGDIYMNEQLYDLALSSYLSAYEAPGRVSDSRSLEVAGAFVNRAAFDAAETFIEGFTSARAAELAEETEREVYNLRASIALSRGESEEAARILEDLIEQDPRNGRALLLLGEFYAGDGSDPVKASYYYGVAQTVAATAVEAYIQHARLKVRQQNYPDAIELLEEAQSLRYQNNVARYLDAIRRVLN